MEHQSGYCDLFIVCIREGAHNGLTSGENRAELGEVGGDQLALDSIVDD